MTQQELRISSLLNDSEAVNKGYSSYKDDLMTYQAFEFGVIPTIVTMANLEPRYIPTSQTEFKNPFFVKMEDGQLLSLSDKALGDIVAKSSAIDPISKESVSLANFNNVSGIPVYDANGLQVGVTGTHVLKHLLGSNKRSDANYSNDSHKTLEYQKIVRSFSSPSHAFNAISSSTFLEELSNVAELNTQKEVDHLLKFDIETGRLRAAVYWDSIEPIEGDTINYGVSLWQGLYGNQAFTLSIGSIRAICQNMMVFMNSFGTIKVRQTSFKNVWLKIGEFIYNNARMNDLFDSDRVWLRKAMNGSLATEDRDNMYPILAKTVFDLVDREKFKVTGIMQNAVSYRITDVEKELKALQKQGIPYVNDQGQIKHYKVSGAETSRIQYIIDNDPTIDDRNFNQYYMSQAFTRLANWSYLSDSQSDKYQKIGALLVEHKPLVV